ncbi:hypothetical protein TTHERM_000703549 (macronuclear) [Tetrahymena thermophila SB210]|uniref:Uncharacterized protein n=1 Tax=Tetrahymena thermophila (strain SB210) TaxID=312017 RepID=W7WYJ8_TETTS|nr:hypothetical protein TTHERM_000703549 [Tetrahymena thermophila SB210]EWS71950.1 hypothetical protein TTHERM_000703549 [Tetrahymena thermophila SB210]|eukprot:XP_012655510.1 hypothetical protein TTHERM_000703549 [Tetrahymena thermophila SB210]
MKWILFLKKKLKDIIRLLFSLQLLSPLQFLIFSKDFLHVYTQFYWPAPFAQFYLSQDILFGREMNSNGNLMLKKLLELFLIIIYKKNYTCNIKRLYINIFLIIQNFQNKLELFKKFQLQEAFMNFYLKIILI